ncbi:hypothetical protein PoB_003696300, partial [Plakobranchus ocellatus]
DRCEGNEKRKMRNEKHLEITHDRCEGNEKQGMRNEKHLEIISDLFEAKRLTPNASL